ncbi:MAG: S-layer homology domain-containing protein [Firmicutes bacterium]|nr:S-layer homology domain-containing protein [Bacillota bacterium]
MKRFLSLLLSLALTVSALPMVVFAEESDITFSDLSVDIAEDAVYGDLWGDIVAFSGGTATANGEPVEGTFTLKDADAPVPGAGRQAWQILFNSADGNYTDVIAQSGTIEVAKAELTATVRNLQVVYGSESPYNAVDPYQVEIAGFVEGDDESVLLGTPVYTGYTKGDNADVYSIELSGLSAQNYNISYYPGQLTVGPRLIQIWNNSLYLEKTYDGLFTAGADISKTGSLVISNKYGSDDVDIDFNRNTGNAVVTFDQKDVGQYSVTIAGMALIGADKDNYRLNATYVMDDVSGEITPADITGEMPPANKKVLAGSGSFEEPVIKGFASDPKIYGTFLYSYGDITRGSQSDVESALSRLPVGTTGTINWTFDPSPSDNLNNYRGTVTGSINFTVAEILFLVAGTDATVDNVIDVKIDAPVYGDSWSSILDIDASHITALTGDGAVSGTYSLDVSGNPGVGTQTYRLLFSGTSASHTYTDMEVLTGSVAIAPRPLTVTWSGDENLVYDENPKSVTAEVSGAVDGEDVTVSVRGGDKIIPGTYQATASLLFGPGVDPDNYCVNEADLRRSYTIVPGTITGDIGFTPVKTSGKTFADLQINYGTLEPANGVLIVTDATGEQVDDSTPVEKNEIYNYRYDYPHYYTYYGSFVPWKTASGSVSDDSQGKNTLSFNTNGGSELVSISKLRGNIIDLEEYTPHKEGFEFEGWYSDPQLTNRITTIQLGANMTVYAKWVAVLPAGGFFTDVAADSWYQAYVNDLYERDIIHGFSDGSFKPNSSITRAQFVTILANMAKADLSSYTDVVFTDVAKGDWYFGATCWAYENGVVMGHDDGTFRPNAPITRQELCTVLDRFAGNVMKFELASPEAAEAFADADQIAPYAAASVNKLKAAGIISGKGNNIFAPNAPATRAEVCKMVSVLLDIVETR